MSHGGRRGGAGAKKARRGYGVNLGPGLHAAHLRKYSGTMDARRADRLFRIGAIGTGVMAVCCFTPLLVWVLPVIGLAAVLGWIDYVLLPLLVLFMLIGALGWDLSRRAQR